MTKSLNKKHFFIFLFTFVALLTLVGGLIFYFIANRPVNAVPKSISIQKIDNDYCLVAEYQNNYTYQFKVEQFIDSQYLTVDIIDSKVNLLNLTDNNIFLVPGKQYRFSVCFTNETKVGDFSSPEVAIVCSTLKPVDYQSVVFIEGILSWDAVDFADNYNLKLVNQNGEITDLSSVQAKISLEDVEAGKYTIFISSSSNNNYYLPSVYGQGYEIEISRQNQIISASLSQQNILSIVTTEKASLFELYQDQDLLATFSAEEISNLNYQIDLNFILKDTNKTGLKIKSLANGYILESDFKDI